MEILHQGEWLTLCKRDKFEFVKRTKAKGAAIIIAVNEHKELILVEQYRASVDKLMLELPAGLVGDDTGHETETMIEGAIRELLEETGYESLDMEEVAKGPVSSGMSSEMMSFCFTSTLVKRHAGGGLEDEDITVREVPLGSIQSFIYESQNKGLMIDPKIYIGLHFCHIKGLL